MAELPKSADVVIVGGGMTGASALYYLARSEVSAVLLERDVLSSGSTSKAAGGFRAQFSDELNIKIMVEAIRRFERFGDEPGADIDLKQWGYLFLLRPDEMGSFRDSVALQRDLGVDVRPVSAEEAQSIVPGLNIDDIAGGTFSPTDGYATPAAAVQGYAAAARRLGATIVEDCEVTGIDLLAGKVSRVVTSRGDVSTPTVICAGGIWTNQILQPLGIELPVTPEQRFIFLSEPGDPLPRQLPLTVDYATGFYFHREGQGLVIAGRESTMEDLAPAAVHRLPFLETKGVRPGWSGYYAVTPDHNAVIGKADHPEGLIYATGFSGHGFMQGPVVGEYLADLATDSEPFMDLSAFSAERFVQGSPRPELRVI